MKFDRTGQVSPGFYVLGHRSLPVYLLDGRRPALFDSGISCLAPLYLEQMGEILQGRSPRFLFLTHVHFDHCGGAAHFKKAHPQMVIAASRRAAHIVTRPNALRLMAQLNQAAAVEAGLSGREKADYPEFEPFTVERMLADGDRIELEPGQEVEVLATPGHTRDFLSYYLPQKKILVASEAVGVAQLNGDIITEFLVDYQSYLDSMQRLSRLPLEVLCQGHHWVFTGQDARDYIQRSLQAARDYHDWVLRMLDQEQGDVERVVRRVKAREWDNRRGVKQGETAYLLNTRARVGHLAARAGWREQGRSA